MDIYSYIRSRDVADYCREIGKTWNTYEMAIIIGKSNCTADEMRDAWSVLIANYPDMPEPSSNPNYTVIGTHNFLTGIMGKEDTTVELFFEWYYVDIPTPYKRGDVLKMAHPL